MSDHVNAVLRDPVLFRAVLGLLATFTLEHVHTIVDILVGLATLGYLCLRIRAEWVAGKAMASRGAEPKGRGIACAVVAAPESILSDPCFHPSHQFPEPVVGVGPRAHVGIDGLHPPAA